MIEFLSVAIVGIVGTSIVVNPMWFLSFALTLAGRVGRAGREDILASTFGPSRIVVRALIEGRANLSQAERRELSRVLWGMRLFALIFTTIGVSAYILGQVVGADP